MWLALLSYEARSEAHQQREERHQAQRGASAHPSYQPPARVRTAELPNCLHGQ